MTVAELIRQLQRFPDDAVVVFEPAEFCSQGFPVWQDASVSHPCTEDEGEDLNAVVVRLRDEYEEID